MSRQQVTRYQWPAPTASFPPSRIVGRSKGPWRTGLILPFQGTPRAEWSCSVGFDWDKFVPQLFGLPFEFCFNPFFSLSVSGGPQALVIFDLVFDHGVKDQCDLVGGCHSGTFGAQLGFHSAQVVA